MELWRSLELMQRASEISDQLLADALIAKKERDSKKLDYLVQESIVLRKISKLIANSVLNTYNDE